MTQSGSPGRGRGRGRGSSTEDLIRAVQRSLNAGNRTQAAIRRDLRSQGFRFRDSRVNEIVRASNQSVVPGRLRRLFFDAFRDFVVGTVPRIVSRILDNLSVRITGTGTISYQTVLGSSMLQTRYNFVLRGNMVVGRNINLLAENHLETVAEDAIIADLEAAGRYTHIVSTIRVLNIDAGNPVLEVN